MTVGQRIARKRKELGLSQEGLGERLGVSRQAIYKWESDAALPEIEKLVNLSREFSVSVGWLLGEEDDAPEKPELTPEQLRMVEEIVGRYLAAQPPSEKAGGEPSPKRRRWPYVLAALAVLVLVGMFSNLSYRQDWVNQNYLSLETSVRNINANLSSQIDGITQQVEEMLQSQLTAEQSAQVASTDYRANTITIEARALPRAYVEGMTAEFILTSGGETITAPGELGEGHAFTAQLTGPLSDDVTVSVAFCAGDERQTQLLDQFTGLYTESFPLALVQGHLGSYGNEIEQYGRATVVVGPRYADRISDIRLGLFRDRKLLAWYEYLDKQPDDHWAYRVSFRLEGKWVMEPGYEYCRAAVIVDEYGREWVCPDSLVTYDPEEEAVIFVRGDEEVGGDPENWDY